MSSRSRKHRSSNHRRSSSNSSRSSNESSNELWGLMKQGLDQRDNHSFEDWLSVAIIEVKTRNPKVAEELETGERLEAFYPRIDSEGDEPKFSRAIKSAYFEDVPETTYEQIIIMRANKLRDDFANDCHTSGRLTERTAGRAVTNDTNYDRLPVGHTENTTKYKTFTDRNIPLPLKADQVRDYYGALNADFFADFKAYYKNAEARLAHLPRTTDHLIARYNLRAAGTKSGAKTNITFATFQQRNCNFITSKGKSAWLTERTAGRTATNETDDNQGEETRRERGRGTHGNHKGRRADIISREESGGAAKQEEGDYDSDYFESPPGPCMNCNQHLIPDQKDDRAQWHWRNQCPNAKKVIKDYLEYKRKSNKMKPNENESLGNSRRHCTRYHESAYSPRSC